MSRLPLALATAMLAGCTSYQAQAPAPTVATFCSAQGSAQGNEQCRRWYAANPHLRPPSPAAYQDPYPGLQGNSRSIAEFEDQIDAYNRMIERDRYLPRIAQPVPPEPWPNEPDYSGTYSYGPTVPGAPQFGYTFSGPNVTCRSFSLAGRRDLGTTVDCY